MLKIIFFIQLMQLGDALKKEGNVWNDSYNINTNEEKSSSAMIHGKADITICIYAHTQNYC